MSVIFSERAAPFINSQNGHTSKQICFILETFLLLFLPFQKWICFHFSTAQMSDVLSVPVGMFLKKNAFEVIFSFRSRGFQTQLNGTTDSNRRFPKHTLSVLFAAEYNLHSSQTLVFLLLLAELCLGPNWHSRAALPSLRSCAGMTTECLHEEKLNKMRSSYSWDPSPLSTVLMEPVAAINGSLHQQLGKQNGRSNISCKKESNKATQK